MPFTLLSEENLPIRGNLLVPEHPQALVVAVHGFKGFKDWGFFPWLADELAASRIAVCRFNMSRCGIGENPETFERLDLFADDTYSTQIADLLTVVRYAQDRLPDLPTFLLGHSRGGGIALLAAARVPHLRGVVTWSAISHVDRWDEFTVRDWRTRGYMDIENARTKQMMRMSPAILDDYDANRQRLDILAATSRLDVPLLVIHGARDESVPVSEGRTIAAKAREGSLCVIERASHTYNAIHPLIHVPFALTMAGAVSAHFVCAYR